MLILMKENYILFFFMVAGSFPMLLFSLKTLVTVTTVWANSAGDNLIIFFPFSPEYRF